MTIGEIKKNGRNIGQTHIEADAYQMVMVFINNRIHEIKVHLSTAKTKTEKTRYQGILDKLEKAEESEYFKVLVERAKENLMKAYEAAANSVNIGLINAEYFDFTGKI